MHADGVRLTKQNLPSLRVSTLDLLGLELLLCLTQPLKVYK